MKLQRFPDHKLESYQDKQSVDFSDIERIDKEVSKCHCKNTNVVSAKPNLMNRS